jgi:hypothetical protein
LLIIHPKDYFGIEEFWFLLDRLFSFSSRLSAVTIHYAHIAGHIMEESNKGLLLKDTSIITMESSTVLSNHDVKIEKGSIKDINPTGVIPIGPNCEVIDCSGKFTIPGLMDMHVHLLQEEEMLLYLANGVTSVRNMWGAPIHFYWREKMKNEELFCPNIYTTSPLMDGSPAIWPNSVVFENPEEAKQVVSEYKRIGYQQLKVYNGLSKKIYDAIWESGIKHQMPLVGHVPFALDLDYVLDKGQYCVEHFDGFTWRLIPQDDLKGWNPNDTVSTLEILKKIDETAIPIVIDKVIQTGTWICPTLVVMIPFDLESERTFLERPENDYLLPSTLREWSSMTASARQDPAMIKYQNIEKDLSKMYASQLREAGGKMIVGTDTPNPHVIPGFSIHDELESLVETGYTPYEVLEGCTKNGAEFMNDLDVVGTVSIGKRADLLLLDENPLMNISNTRKRYGIVWWGKWFPQKTLDKRMEDLRKSMVKKGEEAKKPQERKEIDINRDTLMKYVGEYGLMPNFILTITRENDRLISKVTGEPKLEIFPESNTKFFFKAFDAQIKFPEGNYKNAAQLTLRQNDRDMVAKRISS